MNWSSNKCKLIHDSHPSWDPPSASFNMDEDHIIMNWRKELYVTDRMKKGRLLKVWFHFFIPPIEFECIIEFLGHN